MTRKRAAIAGGVVLLLLLGAVLALPFILDVNQYRGRVQAALHERLGRDVSLGEMRLSLLPLGLRVEAVEIGEDPAVPSERPFAAVEELYVSPKILPLLTGTFELRAVELRRPTIELVRTASGEWNFANLGGTTDTAPDEGEGGTTVVLNRLVVTDGRVALTDLSKPAGAAGRAVYENIDVELEDFAPNRAFDLRLAVTLPGQGAQQVSIEGTGGPIVQDEVVMTPFEGRIRLNEVSISGVQGFLQAEALEGTDSIISGEADLSNDGGRLTAKGALQFVDTQARGLAIGYPIAAEFDVEHDTNAEVLAIRSGTLRLDRTPLSLTGTVNLAPETPVLDVHATASDASLAEAARLASAFGVAFGSGTRAEGTLDADVRAKGPADAPALEGHVRLRNVSISGDDIPQPVRTAAVDLALTPEVVRSNDFTVSAGGTSVGVRATVTGYTTEKPSIDAHVRTKDADVGELLNAAHAWGVAAADGTRGSGRLTVDVQATGPIDALTYRGSGQLSSATLQTPALTQPLHIRNARLTFDRDAAVLDDLSASIGKTTADGRLSVRNFTAPQVQFQLAANTIDVAEMQALVAPSAEGGAPQAPASADEESVLTRMTGGGSMRVGSIVYDAILLEDVQATAALDRGVVRLDPVTAMLFGGRHRGAIVMDTRVTPAAISVASNLESVDANRLASAVTSLRDVIFGALGSKVQMSLSAAEGADLARSLNGTMAINLADGRIANMNLTQEIGNIARFVTGQPAGERTTQVAGLSGSFTVTDGVALTDDLTASIEGGTVGMRGSVNLVDQSLNLRMTAVLSQDFSSRVGGTRVGGFMTTALANQQGELVIPMVVTGTTQAPRFAPDVQQVAEMRLKNLVPNLRDPQSLTSGILGALGGKPADGQGTGSRVGDIVGAITGRRGGDAETAKPETPPEGQEQAPPKEERKDPGSQIQDALRGILGGRQK